MRSFRGDDLLVHVMAESDRANRLTRSKHAAQNGEAREHTFRPIGVVKVSRVAHLLLETLGEKITA